MALDTATAKDTLDDWRHVMRVNLDSNLALLRETHPLLKLAPRGGRQHGIPNRSRG